MEEIYFSPLLNFFIEHEQCVINSFVIKLRKSMKGKVLLSVTCFTLLLSFISNGAAQRGLCSWSSSSSPSECPENQFRCFNGKCIQRSWYCDNANDCGDNSDENFCCNCNSCPENPPFSRCKQSNKCIPEEWFCDGIKDCPDGDDEEKCVGVNVKTHILISEVLQWIYSQKNSQSATETWGTRVDKLAVALYFTDRKFTSRNNETRREFAYEISTQLLSRLSTKKLKEISSTDLASFVNAFIVTCLNPRKFHGLDIVQELRSRVNQQNYTNPYVLLSLCNAGDTITESDKMKLMDIFSNKHRPFWTDMQAFSVMALACASKQQGNVIDLETLRELTLELKQHQYRNGSIEYLQTTALVMQALLSAESDSDPDNFDEEKALQEIMRNLKPDGSFGDLMNTYFVLPVLKCKSLADIDSSHCQSMKIDKISALENLANREGPKIRVHYSLWIGNEKDLERNLVLRVPANMSFYGIMEIAAEIDTRYRFEYVVKDRKPYVKAISGFRENPEKGEFWFLYLVKDGQPLPSQDSPADVTPKGNDHFVMWYRSGSWIN